MKKIVEKMVGCLPHQNTIFPNWREKMKANSFGHLVRVLVFMGLLSIFLANFFIKIESHGNIYIFKNYFVTVFLIFNNKRYLNKYLF